MRRSRLVFGDEREITALVEVVMSRVLLVDHDPVANATLGASLRLARYEVATASSGEEAVRIAELFDADVAMIDVLLPDTSGLEVLRRLRALASRTACIMITGTGTGEDTVKAMRLGACDWLTKPLLDDEVLAAVRRGLLGRHITCARREGDLHEVEPHALMRLTEKAIEFIGAARDATTLSDFGHAIGVSPGGIRNWCRTAGIPARAFLKFSRALRAVYRHQQTSDVRPEHLLDIVDERTLSKFLVDSGGTAKAFPATVREFVTRQSFIMDPRAISTVLTALRTHDT